ncbi:hypothetical protein Bpfe_029368, partial [Biomphalaria pfeifferi]
DNKLILKVPLEGGGNEEHTRLCIKEYKEKYLVQHTTDGKQYDYMCMQFISRGDHVVQFRVSKIQRKSSLELCSDNNLEFDPYPFVHTALKVNTTQCPFAGGYNMNGEYANKSFLCHYFLPLRMESECDSGSGIIFNFRSSDCTPKIDIRPKERLTFKTKCVTHWSQGDYSFIILQLVDDENKLFCLRTSDPLNNIKVAYLWLKVKCDLAVVPIDDYIKLNLEKRSFSSTCADEMDFCQVTMCDSERKSHCAHTCGLCHSENQIGQCAFQEQFRGHWIDSGKNEDVSINIEAYSLNAGVMGKYDCLNLPSETQPERKVLLELNNNGCVPRYACVDMEKVTSTVMKFQISKRIMWPTNSPSNQKDKICESRNFGASELKETPPRLVINKANLKEVPCDLPERLRSSVTFKHHDDKNPCGGCLHYEPGHNPNQFSVIPFNCSKSKRSSQYNCLATFHPNDNSFSVVAKGQDEDGVHYVYWVFTGAKDIKLLKASDALLYESDPASKHDLIVAQYYITPEVEPFCRDLQFFPRFMPLTTTPAASVTDFNTQLQVFINDVDGSTQNNDRMTETEGGLKGPQTEPSRTVKGENQGSHSVLSSTCATLSILLFYILTGRTFALVLSVT